MIVSRRSLLAFAPTLLTGKRSEGYRVYFGTSTRKGSRGIYAARFDSREGILSTPELAAEAPNPSFIAIHPNHGTLYTVAEVAGRGAITSYSIDQNTGKLAFLNRASAHGTRPAYLELDQTGRALIVANYGDGIVAALPVRRDGSLAESVSFVQHHGSSVHQRQEGPHPHCANISRDNRFVIVADLGLDKLCVYRLNASSAKLEPNNPPFFKTNAGAGPRHFTFHPKRRLAYVNNELQSTATALTWDARRGSFQELQSISTLPPAFNGNNSTAETLVHPRGNFLYVSNRGHNSIAVFAIARNGKLSLTQNAPSGGAVPGNFAIDPSGRFLLAANLNSDNVVVFRIDESDGSLKPTGQALHLDDPGTMRFVQLMVS